VAFDIIGQPRVGNAKFARYVEKMIGEENIFRGASAHHLISTRTGAQPI
jgi:hypothetical protein